MRQRLSTFMILLLVSACADRGVNQRLQAELLEMAHADQKFGDRAMALAQGLPETQAELLLFVKEQDLLYTTNFARLEELVATYGWPGHSLVGVEGTEAALIVLSHASIDQQKAFLPLLRQAVLAGEMNASQLARREDAILVDEGKGQIYGTYFISGADGKPILAPVGNPTNLEERRKSVGLPSMEEQFRQLEAELGTSLVRGDLETASE